MQACKYILHIHQVILRPSIHFLPQVWVRGTAEKPRPLSLTIFTDGIILNCAQMIICQCGKAFYLCQLSQLKEASFQHCIFSDQQI